MTKRRKIIVIITIIVLTIAVSFMTYSIIEKNVRIDGLVA